MASDAIRVLFDGLYALFVRLRPILPRRLPPPCPRRACDPPAATSARSDRSVSR